MPVNKPRIAGKPAIERRRTAGLQPVNVYPAKPGEEYLEPSSRSGPVTRTVPDPSWEGQLYVYSFNDESGLNRRAQIYVAVDIEGVLTWKVAKGETNLLNAYTGKPYDPIYDG